MAFAKTASRSILGVMNESRKMSATNRNAIDGLRGSEIAYVSHFIRRTLHAQVATT